MKKTITIAAVRSEREEYKGRGGKEYPDRFNSERDDESDKLYCKVCFYNHEGKCHHIKMKCDKCYKTDHI